MPQKLIDAGSYNGQPFGRFDSLDPTDDDETTQQQRFRSVASPEGKGATRIAASPVHRWFALVRGDLLLEIAEVVARGAGQRLGRESGESAKRRPLWRRVHS